ncbi:putative mitogen-activated protein kinase kinase kinase 7-like [Drosophila montana]|uniref:putative mitogen-activated protein kinase kinase kinase 7-like n=1 Tax=Drosophila montana TaxID=40370 RepID=UPI00313C4E57
MTYLALHNLMFQCAKAVEYLHNQKPTVLHRDLKPNNLLLFNRYRTLKICDFASKVKCSHPSVCVSVHMNECVENTFETISNVNCGNGYRVFSSRVVSFNNTTHSNSTLLLQAQVLEGKKYTEKCDVYSFGIILWEVMSRKKPFDHLENPNSFTIEKLSANGVRPKLEDVMECDNMKIIKTLIEKCWAHDPSKRPAMSRLSLFLGRNYYGTGDYSEPLPPTCDADYQYRIEEM